MEVRFSGHSAYRTQYHIVWIPKYRRRILNPGVASYLVKVLTKQLRSLPGVELVEQSIQADHIHLVLIIPPRYAVAAIVGTLKQQTAKALRAKFTWLEDVYWREPVVWSPGYFVSTVGIDEAKILWYVRHQEAQDSGQAKLDLR
ncbi:MAG: IS200/IS605 family transposase [Nitrospirales bacterium]|nr:MAG: IS200/IS605 family transposase [Nitrospirales bacterium]